MDLTGKRHSTYLTVVYIKQKIDIKLVTSKSRKPEDLVEAFFICLAFLKKRHVKVYTVPRMDNKVSTVFTAMLDDQNLEPEFVPPGQRGRAMHPH